MDRDPPQRLPRPVAARPPGAFDESYAGTPPWDIGRPQPAFQRLAEAGAISGRVLDAGCGTGEHVLMVARLGLEATGIDSAPSAIEKARRKAADRRVDARFLVWDALCLAELGEQFDTVMDSGLFHIFDDPDRIRYVGSLREALGAGGRLLLCCFSDRQPGEWGPRRVSRDEIEQAFTDGWTVESIEPSRFETNLDPPHAEAWLAVISRT